MANRAKIGLGRSSRARQAVCAPAALGACLGRLIGVAAAALPEQARSAPAAGCTRLAEWQRRASPLDKSGGEQYPCSCDSVNVTGNKD